MIRAVIDANVIISGLFWQGSPQQVYREMVNGRLVMLTTEDLLAELTDTLEKQKFVEHLTRLKLSVADIMEQITLLSDQVLPTDVPENAVRDHEDRAILACAVGGKADCIVTGNRDLLVLSSYEGISILNVQQCLALLDSA